MSRTNVRLIYLCMHIRPGNFVLGAQPTSSVIHIRADWDGTVCLKIPVTTGTSPIFLFFPFLFSFSSSFFFISTSLPLNRVYRDNHANRVLDIEYDYNLNKLLTSLVNVNFSQKKFIRKGREERGRERKERKKENYE